MRLALALASLLVALLLFSLALPGACGDCASASACRRGDDDARTPRTAGVWSLSRRFSLLNLLRLSFPSLREAPCIGWRQGLPTPMRVTRALVRPQPAVACATGGRAAFSAYQRTKSAERIGRANR